MMANDPGSAPPGSPRSPRTLRSRTNSPLMAGGRSFSPGIHADPTFLGLKDRVVGELASRIKKPMSSSSAGFNKNKQGKLSVCLTVDHQILKIIRITWKIWIYIWYQRSSFVLQIAIFLLYLFYSWKDSISMSSINRSSIKMCTPLWSWIAVYKNNSWHETSSHTLLRELLITYYYAN